MSTERARCPHGKQRYYCRKCGGGAFCKHNMRRQYCAECKGEPKCDNDRVKGKRVACLEDFIMDLLETHLSKCFDKFSLEKGGRLMDYYGCDIYFLRRFMEKKIGWYNEFLATDTQMTWENLELDAIKPASAFDLSDPEHVRVCAHWSNLQPLLNKHVVGKGEMWNDYCENYWTKYIYEDPKYCEIFLP